MSSNEVDDFTAGINLNGNVSFGATTLIAEYTAATEEFSDPAFDGAEPSAANLEFNYEFNINGRSSTFALGFQMTDDAVGLELPESKVLIGLGVEVNDAFNLGFEISNDEDYDIQDGGTGESNTTFLLQLAVPF